MSKSPIWGQLIESKIVQISPESCQWLIIEMLLSFRCTWQKMQYSTSIEEYGFSKYDKTTQVCILTDLGAIYGFIFTSDQICSEDCFFYNLAIKVLSL